MTTPIHTSSKCFFLFLSVKYIQYTCQVPPPLQAQVRDLCGNKPESATSTRAGLSQRPLPEQAQGSNLSGNSPKQATFMGAGLNNSQDFRVTPRSTE